MAHKKLEELSNSELIELFQEAENFGDEGDLIPSGKLEIFTQEIFGRCSTRYVDACVHNIYRELANRFITIANDN
jgi:hypothetical protein